VDRFLLADDHAVVKTGISLLIKELYPSAVIDTAHDGDSAHSKIVKNDYDLVMLDVHMPNTDSLALVDTILAIKPKLKILIFTMASENIFAKRFLKLGVSGFLSKDSSDEEIKRAITKVSLGRKYISEGLFSDLTDDSLRSRSDNPFEDLSDRELEIVTHLIKGKSVGEICDILSIQNSTVSTHKARAFEKLKVKNIIELREMARIYQLI